MTAVHLLFRPAARRFGRVTLLALLLMGMFTAVAPAAGAQDASPIAVVDESTATPTVTTTPTVASVPTETPLAPPAEPVTETPASASAETPVASGPDWQVNLEPAATETAVAATATPTPATSSNVSTNAVTTGVRVIVHSGDTQNGPLLKGICAFMNEASAIPIFTDTGCTDENGEVFLNVYSQFDGSRVFKIQLSVPDGYVDIDPIIVVLTWGTTAGRAVALTPIPDGTETLKAINGGTGNPMPGVCWSYYRNNVATNSPAELLIGPLCDTDGDGTVVATPIPYAAYCLVATAPTDYDVVGPDTTCAPAQARNATITKSFVSYALGTSAVINVTVKSPWGTPVGGVCISARGSGPGGYFEAGAGCTGDDGRARIGGLLAGSVSLIASSFPSTFKAFPGVTVTTTLGQSTDVNVVAPYQPQGDIRITAVLGYGPQKLAGACWSYNLANGDAPSNTVIIGPVCDADGDGVAVLAGVARGAFCIVLISPPPGYVRASNQGFSYCGPDMQGGEATVGFSAAPTPTPTRVVTKTATPRATATPSATPTRVVTPPPAGNEPNGGLTVKTCAYAGVTFDAPFFTLCTAAPAGVKLAVIQNGVEVERVTTLTGGVTTVHLDSRSPYSLKYLSGIGNQWIPGAGESAKTRYGAQQTFIFEPAPAVDRTWTVTVSVKYVDYWNGSGYSVGAPIGGGCFTVIGSDDQTLLPESCDSDNNGVTVLGTLPPLMDGSGYPVYRVKMTQAPPGFPIFGNDGISFGQTSAGDPTQLSAGFQYFPGALKIHVVDPDGKPVAGFCFTTQATNTGQVPTIVSLDCDYAGTLTVSSPNFGLDAKIDVKMVSSKPGWLPDLWEQLVAPSGGFTTEITFVVRAYGSDGANRASLHIKFQIPDVSYPTPRSSNDLHKLCLTLSPAAQPNQQACAAYNGGDVLFRDLSAGSYTATIVNNGSNCTAPSSAAFTIHPGDLGKQVEATVPVRCDFETRSCFVVRYATKRSVDLYYGELKDENGAFVSNTVQLSESIPLTLRDGILSSNPNSALLTLPALSPWVNGNDGLTSGSSWAGEPDVDGNAQARLLNAFGGYGAVSAGKRVSRGDATSIVGVGFEFNQLTNANRADYPECKSGDTDVDVQTFLNATVHYYELNASLTKSTRPTPTPYPSPEAVCDTSVSRDITAYYGALTDQNGKVILNGLALSDHIPAGLRQAIENGESPGKVGQSIGNWVGPDATDEDWGFGSPENLDAQAALSSQYNGSANSVVAGAPENQGDRTYTFRTYRYYDEAALPDGCSAPAVSAQGVQASSLGRLIPVMQMTTVNVSYVLLNAVGERAATATSTASATPGKTTPGSTPTAPGQKPTAGATSTPGISTLPVTGTSAGTGSGDSTGIWLVLAGLAAAMFALAAMRRRGAHLPEESPFRE